jgi:hypothetical protein
MGKERECTCKGKHRDHICVLRCKEKTKEVEQKTGNPNVVCLNCGIEANSRDNVCSPVQLFV